MFDATDVHPPDLGEAGVSGERYVAHPRGFEPLASAFGGHYFS